MPSKWSIGTSQGVCVALGAVADYSPHSPLPKTHAAARTLGGLACISVSSKYRVGFLRWVIFPLLPGLLPEAFEISSLFFLPLSMQFSDLSPGHQSHVSHDSVLSLGFSET